MAEIAGDATRTTTRRRRAKSYGRGVGLARILLIIRDLSRSPRTVEEMARRHRVTARTIYRDLDTLSAVGIEPAQSFEAGHARYSLPRGWYRIWTQEKRWPRGIAKQK